MGTMETTTGARLMFSHDVPDTEPPLGTVAEFHHAFISGGGSSSGLMIRTQAGWSTSSSGSFPRTWEELTDLDAMNAAIVARNPQSKSRFGAAHVRLLAFAAEEGTPQAR